MRPTIPCEANVCMYALYMCMVFVCVWVDQNIDAHTRYSRIIMNHKTETKYCAILYTRTGYRLRCPYFLIEFSMDLFRLNSLNSRDRYVTIRNWFYDMLTISFMRHCNTHTQLTHKQMSIKLRSQNSSPHSRRCRLEDNNKKIIYFNRLWFNVFLSLFFVCYSFWQKTTKSVNKLLFIHLLCTHIPHRLSSHTQKIRCRSDRFVVVVNMVATARTHKTNSNKRKKKFK